MTATQATIAKQKKTSIFLISFLVDIYKKAASNVLATVRNTLIPLGDKPEAWDYFLDKTVRYNTQHQFITGCLLMVAFYTYPIVLMSMYAHMRSLIIMKELPMIYAFTVNMTLIILCKESIEAGFNYFWGHFTNHMISSWCQEKDGNKNISSTMDRSEYNNAEGTENSQNNSKANKESSDNSGDKLDIRGDISRFCNSFIQLTKNGISRASRIALALIYLLPRTNLPTIGVFFTSSMLFYNLLNRFNTIVTTLKKDYNNTNNKYFKLQNDLKTKQSENQGNPTRYKNHKDTITENNTKALTIQSHMLLPRILINYLNSFVQNILSITLPVILLTQDLHFEQGALEQAKEAFLRIFLGIDPISKDPDTLSTFSESFDQVQKIDQNIIGNRNSVKRNSPQNSNHYRTKNNTHTALIDYLHAFIHATKISSLYTSILSLLHHSILFTLSNPSSHILQAVISLSWYNTLFLKLTATWALCFCFELLTQRQPNRDNEISHTTNFALAATFTLSLLSTISFPVLLASPSILYPGIITLSGISTLTCIKLFKYETQTRAVAKQPCILYQASPSSKEAPLVSRREGDDFTIDMKNLTCQWQEGGAKCDIIAHTYQEGCSYLHYGESGAGKSNTFRLIYLSLIYDKLNQEESCEDLNRQLLGKYGIDESFSKPNNPPHINITERKGVKIIPIHISQKTPTQNIDPPIMPNKLKDILTDYFNKDHTHSTQELSDLQEFVYNELVSADLLPDSIPSDTSDLNAQTQLYPELELLQSWKSIHDSMIKFIKNFPLETKVIQAITNQNLSSLTGGNSSGGQKGLIKAAFCYALLKLRLPSFQLCLLLDEPFSETGNKREDIFRLLNQAVKGDQNSRNKPMLHVTAHHLSANDISYFTHKIKYPEANVEAVHCDDSPNDPQNNHNNHNNQVNTAKMV